MPKGAAFTSRSRLLARGGRTLLQAMLEMETQGKNKGKNTQNLGTTHGKAGTICKIKLGKAYKIKKTNRSKPARCQTRGSSPFVFVLGAAERGVMQRRVEIPPWQNDTKQQNTSLGGGLLKCELRTDQRSRCPMAQLSRRAHSCARAVGGRPCSDEDARKKHRKTMQKLGATQGEPGQFGRKLGESWKSDGNSTQARPLPSPWLNSIKVVLDDSGSTNALPAQSSRMNRLAKNSPETQTRPLPNPWLKTVRFVLGAAERTG